MKTFLLRFKTTPSPSGGNVLLYAGAFWTIWIRSIDEDSAMRAAIDYAGTRGWLLSEGKDIFQVERDYHLEDPELLSMFDKAQTEGIAAIIDTFKSTTREDN